MSLRREKFPTLYVYLLVNNDLLMHTNCIKKSVWQDNLSCDFLSGKRIVLNVILPGLATKYMYTGIDINCINSQMLHLYNCVIICHNP